MIHFSSEARTGGGQLGPDCSWRDYVCLWYTVNTCTRARHGQWLSVYTPWLTLKCEFSCALIKSATAHEPVSSAHGLRFLCFYCERDRQIQTERWEGEGDSLWWARCLACFVIGYTHTHADNHITQWCLDKSVSVQEMGLIYLTCWSTSNCTDSTVLQPLTAAKVMLIIWFNCCKWATTEETSDVFLLLSITFFKHKLSDSWLTAINTSKVTTAS